MYTIYPQPAEGPYHTSLNRKYKKKAHPQGHHGTSLWKVKHDSKSFHTSRHRKLRTNPIPLQGRHLLDDRFGNSYLNTKLSMNIPGIDHIMRSTNKWSKLMWMCVVIVFYGLCVYQLVDRFTVYFQHPVGLEIKMLKNTSVEFPSVAVCPPYGPYIIYIKMLNKLGTPLKETYFNRNFAELNTSLQEIWNESRIRDEDIIITSSCFDKQGESCDDLKLDTYELKTYWGTCIVKILRKHVHYRGPQTRIQFIVNRNEELLTSEILRNKSWMEPIAKQTLFIPHSRHISPLHEVVNLGYKVSKGIEVELRFSIKEFHFLRTVENPCVSPADEIECKKNCVEKDLEQSAKCWLPFMKQNSSLKPCKTLDESFDALFVIESIYSANAGCECPRLCDETVQNLQTDYHAADEPNFTVFTLSYPDNSVEVVTEKYTYTLNTLVSDVGGSLGFIVGLCLFSFIEVIDYMIQSFVMCFYTKCRRLGRRPGLAPSFKQY